VDGECVGKIERGLCIFIGIAHGDDEECAAWMARKLAALRVFPDEAGRASLDLNAVDGSILLISQFTLLADFASGNRPSFIDAAQPGLAEDLYGNVVYSLRMDHKIRVETGSFGADMNVSIENNGPFTVIIDSDDR
jgi:D-tyrosyl-tRNA(Tyr) deacylase